MIRKFFVALFAFTSFTAIVFAQQRPPMNGSMSVQSIGNKDSSSSIGFTGEFVDGSFIPEVQLQHWSSSVFGIELSAGMVYPFEDTDYKCNYLITTEFQFRFSQLKLENNSSISAYMWVAGGQHGYVESDDDYITNFTASTGIGTEFVLNNFFTIPLEIGYKYEFGNDYDQYLTSSLGLRFKI
jgi:hypothetical protein